MVDTVSQSKTITPVVKSEVYGGVRKLASEFREPISLSRFRSHFRR